MSNKYIDKFKSHFKAKGRVERTLSSTIGLSISGALIIAVLISLVFSSVVTTRKQGKAEGMAELIKTRTAPRPVKSPGVAAWLQYLAGDYCEGRLGDSDNTGICAAVIDPSDNVPPVLKDVGAILSQGIGSFEPLDKLQIDDCTPGDSYHDHKDALVFRKVEKVQIGKHEFAVTRNQGSTNAEEDWSYIYLRHAIPHIMDVAGSVQSDTIGGLETIFKTVSLARIYALSEYGTVVSYRMPKGKKINGSETECDVLTSRRLSPTLLSNDFYFLFSSYHERKSPQYSGLYLDFGGFGIVGTVIYPTLYVDDKHGEMRGVVAVDVVFEVDWNEFFRTDRTIKAFSRVNGVRDKDFTWDLVGSARVVPADTSLPGPIPEDRMDSKPVESDGHVRISYGEEDQALANIFDNIATYPTQIDGPVKYCDVSEKETLFAVNVQPETWLLILVHEPVMKWRWYIFYVLAVAWGVFIVWHLKRLQGLAARNQEEAERGQRDAVRELEEKKNLINSMRVPLVVVDPNDDKIKFCNEAAKKIGIKEGSHFGTDVVADDYGSKEYYIKQMQPIGETLKAFGVHIKVTGDDGDQTTKFALIRSVAVAANIKSLNAHERHRIAILFVVRREEESDLTPVKSELEEDERARLQGLMSHGIYDVTKFLVRETDQMLRDLARDSESDESHPTRNVERHVKALNWMSSQVNIGIDITLAALVYWNSEETIEGNHGRRFEDVRDYVINFEKMLAYARSDDEDGLQLRNLMRIHNLPKKPTGETVAGDCIFAKKWSDWEDYPGLIAMCPLDGGIEYFIGETFFNALRHGDLEVKPEFMVETDANEKHFKFTVTNKLRAIDDTDDAGSSDKYETADAKKYSGLPILDCLTRLFGWSDFSARRVGKDKYQVSWKVPALHLTKRDEEDPRRLQLI
jgi:hypothetical protein